MRELLKYASKSLKLEKETAALAQASISEEPAEPAADTDEKGVSRRQRELDLIQQALVHVGAVVSLSLCHIHTHILSLS